MHKRLRLSCVVPWVAAKQVYPVSAPLGLGTAAPSEGTQALKVTVMPQCSIKALFALPRLEPNHRDVEMLRLSPNHTALPLIERSEGHPHRNQHRAPCRPQHDQACPTTMMVSLNIGTTTTCLALPYLHSTCFVTISITTSPPRLLSYTTSSLRHHGVLITAKSLPWHESLHLCHPLPAEAGAPDRKEVAVVIQALGVLHRPPAVREDERGIGVLCGN